MSVLLKRDMSSSPRKLPQAKSNTTASANSHSWVGVCVYMCVWKDHEENFIDLSLTEDNSSPSASLVAITKDLCARTRFIVAQPVTFSAADPERREGPPASVCVYVSERECVCVGGGCIWDVKHMSPRVLRQGGVGVDDEGGGEQRRNRMARRACRNKLKSVIAFFYFYFFTNLPLMPHFQNCWLNN